MVFGMRYHGYHMGVTAENVASPNGIINRNDQDDFALSITNIKQKKLQKEGKFRNEDYSSFKKENISQNKFEADEHPRTGMNLTIKIFIKN